MVTLNRAVAVAKVDGPEAALALIGPLEDRLAGYFHYFGVKGALLQQLQRFGEARDAFDRAISLAGDPTQAAHIRCQIDRLLRGEPVNSAGGVGTLTPAPS